MLMKQVSLTNNACDGVHLVKNHFNLHIAGYATVASEMRSTEYGANVAAFAVSHPYVSIGTTGEYENGVVEMPGGMSTITGLAVVDGVTLFPAAEAGDCYRISGTGRIGGAGVLGELVSDGDMLFCHTNTVGGTKAAVGSKWTIWRSLENELLTINADGEVTVKS